MNVAVKPAAAPFPLREAMRLTAGGVGVVTAGLSDERTGLTVTSAISLSIDPPTMLISVNQRASAWPVIQARRHFCLNVLGVQHQAVAEQFSGKNGEKGVDRYAGARWEALATGALALEDAIASIDCEVDEIIARRSHAIVIGSARAIRVRGGEPLVYGRGRYGAFADF